MKFMIDCADSSTNSQSRRWWSCCSAFVATIWVSGNMYAQVVPDRYVALRVALVNAGQCSPKKTNVGQTWAVGQTASIKLPVPAVIRPACQPASIVCEQTDVEASSVLQRDQTTPHQDPAELSDQPPSYSHI